MPHLTHIRVLLSLGVSAIGGALGLHQYPFPADHAVLALIHVVRPALYAGFTYAYASLWFTSSFFLASIAVSCVSIFVGRGTRRMAAGDLPPYPAPAKRQDLFLVLGEQHQRTSPARAVQPTWLTIPERGLYTGIFVVGAIGSGKTSACMYPYVDQLLAYRAHEDKQKVAGLVLEVKGDFCRQVRNILTRHGREADYVEVSLDSAYRYNPLHNDLDAYALAYGIATLMTNLFGRGKEPFWQQASTNLVKFVILLHQVLDDYVTLFQVYEHVINADKLRGRITEGERHFRANHRRIVVDLREHLFTAALKGWSWHTHPTGDRTWAEWSPDLADVLASAGIVYTVEHATPPARWADKLAQFEAVKRWFEDDWTRIEPKLRTSIIEGISVFLSLFDDNPRVKYTFCPPKETYDPAQNPQGIHGTPLPPLAELIEQGKIVALNFPIAMNPGLARALGTMLKQDFQRAVLARVHQMDQDEARSRRPVLFVCDEYQAFATTGENEPSGDEKFFSLARQARCIPLVATQSISSLRSALTGESWRTLLQGLRTKIFLTLTDDFSAQMAADLCGKIERLKPGYTITEAGQDARVSLVTGRPAAHALATFLPAQARIIVVEDTAELQIEHANLVRLEARREQPHAPAITIRELLRATLRLRPDRIIVGEVRGGEAFDLLQALNTGHAGTLSTIHANSAAQALARLASCALQSGVELPYQAIRQQIADAIQFVLHLSRTDSRRYVQELIRVGRYNGARDCYEPETVFKHEHPRPGPEDVHDTTSSED